MLKSIQARAGEAGQCRVHDANLARRRVAPRTEANLSGNLSGQVCGIQLTSGRSGRI